MQAETLAARWESLRATRPNLRTRDAAAQLGVSEAELLATGLGATVTRLNTDAASLLHALPEVGRCMAITRNEHAVSEVHGRYGGVELSSRVGQVVGEHIDLRVSLARWRHTFALEEPHPHIRGVQRRSIHVFDQTRPSRLRLYASAFAWSAMAISSECSELNWIGGSRNGLAVL